MSTTALKILALVFMFLDHMAEFIPGVPEALHWVGRVSAPLFMFCMLWGFYYTGNRKAYLARMYWFGFGMAVMNIACNLLYREPYQYMHNDIFSTLFLIGVIIWILEIWQRDKKKGSAYILLFALFQAASWGICMAALKWIDIKAIEMAAGSIFPNVIYAEGGVNFIAMGVILYFVRDNKKYISAVFTAFSALIFLSAYGEAANLGRLLENEFCQWMMIAALPFMLAYNGKKGHGLKYLFYVFYPAHILLLYIIGNLLV